MFSVTKIVTCVESMTPTQISTMLPLKEGMSALGVILKNGTVSLRPSGWNCRDTVMMTEIGIRVQYQGNEKVLPVLAHVDMNDGKVLTLTHLHCNTIDPDTYELDDADYVLQDITSQVAQAIINTPN